jgi:hypothetical protein
MATLTATSFTAGGYVHLLLSGAAANTGHTVTRTDSAGNVVTVRSGDPATTDATGAWNGQDYESPMDSPVTYTAKAGATTVATSAEVTLASGGLPWLIHPGKPSRNFRPVVREFRLGGTGARAVVHAVIGRTLPVGQSLRRSSYTGELEIFCVDAADLLEVETILEDGHVLLYRAPGSWVGQGTRYVQIGDTKVERLTRVGTDGRFRVTLPWTEVGRPAGLAQVGPGFMWSDVTAAYSTWNVLMALNPTWNNVLDGVP